MENRLKVLSVKAPWAQLFEFGKNIENRDWQPPTALKEQYIIIHTSKVPDSSCVKFDKVRGEYRLTDDFVEWIEERDSDRLDAKELIKRLRLRVLPALPAQLGCITGAAKLVNCSARTYAASPWFVGEYGWELFNFVRLPANRPVTGKLNFWDLPPELELDVQRDLELALSMGGVN